MWITSLLWPRGEVPSKEEVEADPLLANGITNQKMFSRKISISISMSLHEKDFSDKDEVDEKGKVPQASNRGTSDDGLQKKPAGTSSKLNGGDLKPHHARFGPYYRKRKDEPSIDKMEEAKKRSLAKALGIPDLDQVDLQSREMKKRCADVLKLADITKAREQYADEFKGVTLYQFRDMMIIDGSFFLQLSLLVLGFQKSLEYPAGDVFFQKTLKDNDIKVWIESMFFVGNQIPAVVLETLLANEFFRKILQDVKRSPPPTSGFCKIVLYNLLTGNSYKPAGTEELLQAHSVQPLDCLHALHDLVLGLGPENTKTSGIYQKDPDLEANIEFMDEKHTVFLSQEEESMDNSARKDERKRMFPSATQLYGSFIFIRKLKRGEGVKSIHFKSYYVCAFLYLPEFPEANEAETVLGNLTNYETSQKLVHNGGEVTSYIRMMSDILQTPKDVKYLQKMKILTHSKDKFLYGDQLPEMLEKLSSQEAKLTYQFRVLKHKIEDYSGPPWTRIKSILNLVALLTVLQSVFAVLSYFRPQQ